MALRGRSGRLVSATTIDTSDAPALSSQHGVSSDPPTGNTSTGNMYLVYATCINYIKRILKNLYTNILFSKAVTATKRKGRGPTKSTRELPVTIDPLRGDP